MSKKYGLGRGLSSLIPQKNKDEQEKKDETKTSFEFSNVKKQNNDPSHNFKADGGNSKLENNIVLNPLEEKFSQENVVENDKKVLEISVGDIFVNEQQPRLYFNEEKLNELTESIKQHGIIQPLIVMKKGEKFELLAGERRLRASKKAGLIKVPVIIRKDELNSQKKLELALIENIQRDDLNLIEEAKAYVKLANDFGLSQEEIAKRSGKSRSVIANRVRLTKLPVEVQKSLIEGKISEGHAKLILSLENLEKQRFLYELILKQKMTVRETEQQLNDFSRGVKVGSYLRKEKNSQIKSLENKLNSYLKTKVEIYPKGDGGKISIHYYSVEELDDILDKLGVVN